jgi:hypothetical protein
VDNKINTTEFLSNFFATTARQRIGKMIRGMKLVAEPLENLKEDEVLGENISIIMLWSSIGAIFLKIHFTLDVAKKLAAGGLEKSPEEVSREMALDFMKECSNGVGGFVRSLFESNEMLMGMSLPFLAEGKDELIFRKIRDPRSSAYNWAIVLEDGSRFNLTFEICLLDPKSLLSKIDKLEEAMIEGDKEDTSEGEVEFLF